MFDAVTASAGRAVGVSTRELIRKKVMDRSINSPIDEEQSRKTDRAVRRRHQDRFVPESEEATHSLPKRLKKLEPSTGHQAKSEVLYRVEKGGAGSGAGKSVRSKNNY